METIIQNETIQYKTKEYPPRVYVGTYAKYNNGSIAGAWVDLTRFDNADEFEEFCRELHKDEEDPEFMIQDFENFPNAYYDEGGLPDSIWEFLALDDDDRAMFEAYQEAGLSGSFSDAEDAYSGQFDNDIDFVMDLLESCGDIPRDLPAYIHIDWERTARDIMFDYSEANGYYFRNC